MFTHIFTHMYFKKLQKLHFKLLYQMPPGLFQKEEVSVTICIKQNTRPIHEHLVRYKTHI